MTRKSGSRWSVLALGLSALLTLAGRGAADEQQSDRSRNGEAARDDSEQQNKSRPAKESDNASQRRSAQDDRAGAHDDDAQHHAALGVSLDESDGRVRVLAVLPGSPAAKAGLRIGDEIVSVDDQRVRSARELSEEIGAQQPGNRVELGVRRGGERTTVTARLASQEAAFGSRQRRLGQNLRERTTERGGRETWNANRRASYDQEGDQPRRDASESDGQIRDLERRVAQLHREIAELRAARGLRDGGLRERGQRERGDAAGNNQRDRASEGRSDGTRVQPGNGNTADDYDEEIR